MSRLYSLVMLESSPIGMTSGPSSLYLSPTGLFRCLRFAASLMGLSPSVAASMTPLDKQQSPPAVCALTGTGDRKTLTVNKTIQGTARRGKTARPHPSVAFLPGPPWQGRNGAYLNRLTDKGQA
jgi:hypothetical protein